MVHKKLHKMELVNLTTISEDSENVIIELDSVSFHSYFLISLN